MKIIILLFSFILSMNSQSSIVGTWRMCESGEIEGVVSMRNSCWKIRFEENGTGDINDFDAKLNWKIAGDKIEIKSEFSKLDKESPYFSESHYNVKRYSDAKFEYLKMITENDYYFLLVREKK